MSIGDTTRKITAKNKFLDELTDKTPSQQIHFWFSFYKPIFIPIIPSIIIGAIMQYSGKFTSFEIGITILLIYISSRLGTIVNLLKNQRNAEAELIRDAQPPVQS